MTSTKQTPSVSEASTIVRQREAELRNAVADESRLNMRLDNGDDTVMTADLSDAATSVRRASALLNAARQALAVADEAHVRAQAQASPDIAEAVVKLMHEHAQSLGLFGISVSLGDVPAKPPTNQPAVYVAQHKPTKHDTIEGSVSGEAVLHFLADVSWVDRVAAMLDSLRSLAASEGIAEVNFGSVPQVNYRNGITAFSKLLMVKNLRPAVPVLAHEPADFRTNALSVVVRDAVIQQSGMFRDRGVTIGGGNSYASVGVVQCVAEAPSKLGGTTDRDGLTRRTYAVNFTSTSRDMDGDALTTNAVDAVEQIAGAFVAGVGRVESATLTNVRPWARTGREGTARLVLVSRAA